MGKPAKIKPPAAAVETAARALAIWDGDRPELGAELPIRGGVTLARRIARGLPVDPMAVHRWFALFGARVAMAQVQGWTAHTSRSVLAAELRGGRAMQLAAAEAIGRPEKGPTAPAPPSAERAAVP